jgi:hypothetical protein
VQLLLLDVSLRVVQAWDEEEQHRSREGENDERRTRERATAGKSRRREVQNQASIPH